MKKWSSLLVVLTAWPLLTAGGGINPPPCLVPTSPTCGYAIKGPSLSATVFIDPHSAAGDFANPTFPSVDITPNAKQAILSIGAHGPNTVQTSFKITNPAFTVAKGCDVTLTNARFLFSFQSEATLDDWVPAFVLQGLMQQFGVTVSPTNIPIFTSIQNARCLPDPTAAVPLVDGSMPGWLAFDATIQFLVFTGK
jgi:hypothetical protein